MKKIAMFLIMLALLIGITIPSCNGGSTGNGDGPTSPSPASFFFSNLTIEPAEVGPGELVKITVTVANNGGSQGSYDVKLYVDDELEVQGTQSVSLAPGESETVIFYAIRDIPGTYDVDIRTLSGSFSVKQKTVEQKEIIAFASDRDGDAEIYIMNADGSNVVQLTNNTADDYSPQWSPDGNKIAFISYRDGDAEIYIMNADGSNVVKLTDNTAFDDTPSWALVELA